MYEENEKSRDLQMHQTKMGYTWRFGIRTHIRAVVESGPVQMSAMESDVAKIHEVLRGQGGVVHLGARYTGAEKRPENVRAQRTDAIRRDTDSRVAQRRHNFSRIAEGTLKEVRRAPRRLRTPVRARAGRPSHVVESLSPWPGSPSMACSMARKLKTPQTVVSRIWRALGGCSRPGAKPSHH